MTIEVQEKSLENNNFCTSTDTENLSNASGSILELLWAKSNPAKSLLAHMTDTGCCTYQFLSAESSYTIRSFLSRQWGCSDGEACHYASYLSALHDIGKAMPQFQQQNPVLFERLKTYSNLFPEKYREPIHHEYYSSLIFSRIWKKRHIARNARDSYASILSLHHQRNDRERGKKTIPDDWNKIHEALENEIRASFHIQESFPAPQNMDATCILLSSILILCDWIASSGAFDDLPEYQDEYRVFSMKRAQDVLERYGLIHNHPIRSITCFQQLFPAITQLRDIQCKCDSLDLHAPVTVIEAPMGEGKTEAALYLAERMRQSFDKRGLYIALPTQATSNQMYTRTQAMLDTLSSGKVRLMHGTAFLRLDDLHIQTDDATGNLEAEKWLGSPRMSMLDENGVGTVDQAMAGVLKTRFSILRLLGLSNKVLIIDELHAYDAYMSGILESLFRWCRQLDIPVILLSATLQQKQRQEYLGCYTDENIHDQLSPQYPLITQIDKNGHLHQFPAKASKQTTYHFEAERFGDDYNAIAQFALSAVCNGGCYCILMNTVKKAQAVYQALLEQKDQDTETLLFHARFTVGQRAEIEKTCLDKFGKETPDHRPTRMILVATQVVEQSLDLDFDGMLTELAPIDLLLQRAGRVHRHDRHQRPKLLADPVIHVILPSCTATDDLERRYQSSGYVYAPFLLNNTERLIENRTEIQVPADVRKVIETVYAQITPQNLTAWQTREFAQQLMHANADGNSFPPPEQETFFPAQSHPELLSLEIDDGFESTLHATTRLGEPSVRIAFSTPELIETARQGGLSKAQQKEIFLSSVSLPAHWFADGDLEQSSLYKIQKGVLKGCYLSPESDTIQAGKICLHNDASLGVL